MKRTIAVSIIAFAPFFTGWAQSQNPPPSPPPLQPRAEQRFNKLSEDLNLSDKQKTQVQAIFEEMTQRIQAAIQEARTNADKQLQGVLNTDQYQKLQDMWGERQQTLEHHGHAATNSTPNTQQ